MKKPEVIHYNEEVWGISVEASEAEELRVFLKNRIKGSVSPPEEYISTSEPLKVLLIDKDVIEKAELEKLVNEFAVGRVYAF